MDAYFVPNGIGWQPDVPDFRDYTLAHPDVVPILNGMGFSAGKSSSTNTVDLRGLLTLPQDQLHLGASCAFAVLDLAEQMERQHAGRSLNGSKLFLHQMTCRLASANGMNDSNYHQAASLRNTFKALTRFGTPPDTFWPYAPDRFDQQPTDPCLYSFTREYDSLVYVKLDVSGDRPGRLKSREDLLTTIKDLLACEIPCVCGFSVPRTLPCDGHIPAKNGRDELRGGQAALILGCRDEAETARKGKKSKSPKQRRPSGELLFRTSWGTSWGENGYGWLPEEFVTEGFASDFWTALKPEWAGL